MCCSTSDHREGLVDVPHGNHEATAMRTYNVIAQSDFCDVVGGDALDDTAA